MEPKTDPQPTQQQNPDPQQKPPEQKPPEQKPAEQKAPETTTEDPRDKEIRELKENLGKQGRVIGSLVTTINAWDSKRFAALEKPEPPHKEIVFSKDLPKDEYDALTPQARKLMDKVAAMETAENERYMKAWEDAQKNKKPAVDPDEKPADPAPASQAVDIPGTVQATALKLANGDVQKANLIVQSFNAAGFALDGLTKEQLEQKVQFASKLAPDYKPPAAAPTINGAAAGGSAGGEADMSSIIKQATQQNARGNYKL